MDMKYEALGPIWQVFRLENLAGRRMEGPNLCLLSTWYSVTVTSDLPNKHRFYPPPFGNNYTLYALKSSPTVLRNHFGRHGFHIETTT